MLGKRMRSPLAAILGIGIMGLSCQPAVPPAVHPNIQEAVEELPSPEDDAEVTEPPRQIKSVAPAYPPDAQREHIEGVVWLSVVIDTTGIPTDPRIVQDSGMNAGFEQAAIEAALKTRWVPAKSGDRPVPVRVTMKVEFRLR